MSRFSHAAGSISPSPVSLPKSVLPQEVLNNFRPVTGCSVGKHVGILKWTEYLFAAVLIDAAQSSELLFFLQCTDTEYEVGQP
jgi:hypothetical protein